MTSNIYTSLNEIGRRATTIKVKRGFEPARWDDCIQIAAKLALVHTEVAEATEEVRIDNKDKFHMELIDVIIRTLELLHETGADIDRLLDEKMQFNAERPWKHGKKRF